MLGRIISAMFLVFLTGSAFSIEKQDRIAIIGAGVSGLSAAWYLDQAGYSNFVIYEKRQGRR